MEAGYRIGRFLILVTAITLAVTAVSKSASAADHRTRNFIIQAPTSQLAQAVGDAAEGYRRDLAVYWLGSPLPPWPAPCPIRVVAGNLAAQGVTTYTRAPVRDFQMEVIGTPERILDSVLPHEVTHTILATHFGRPLPRWADEGICTTVEHPSEKQKHEAKLREFLSSRRGIAMNKLFLLTEYPSDVLPMYAQGYSVCRFLIAQQDPQTFIQFLHDYMEHPSWTANVRKHYGYESLAELQEYWLAWVSAGSGPVARFAKIPPQQTTPDRLASASGTAADPAGSEIALASGEAADSGAKPPAPITSLASAAPRTNVSQAARDSWYAGRRDKQTAAKDTGPAKNAASAAATATPAKSAVAISPGTMIPPSIQNSGTYQQQGRGSVDQPPSFYSAAQPQPEQQLSGGGRALDQSTGWAGSARKWR